MGKNNTYHGGSTIIRITEGEIDWPSRDPAANETKRSRHRPKNDNRRPSQKEIERQAREDEIQEARMIRSFISQCAAAYAEGKLNASYPAPPKPLRRRINSRGGNISWVAAQASYRAYFHRAYCRLVGKEVPIEKVWGAPSP
jgi:hypothetical protein